MGGSGPVRAQPVTIVSPVRRWWAWWLKLSWIAARANGLTAAPLLRLRFIHFAHWSLVERVPARAPRDRGRRLARPVMLFQSNFNGPIEQYIDAFALRVPGRMIGAWGGAIGFRGPWPARVLKAYVMPRLATEEHYFCAYPEASTQMVLSALRVRERVARFERESAALRDDGAYLAAFDALLRDVQGDL